MCTSWRRGLRAEHRERDRPGRSGSVASVAEIEEAEIGLPATPPSGPLTERVGMALDTTVVSAMPAPPHVEVAGSSPVSPP